MNRSERQWLPQEGVNFFSIREQLRVEYDNYDNQIFESSSRVAGDLAVYFRGEKSPEGPRVEEDEQIVVITGQELYLGPARGFERIGQLYLGQVLVRPSPRELVVCRLVVPAQNLVLESTMESSRLLGESGFLLITEDWQRREPSDEIIYKLCVSDSPRVLAELQFFFR